jgi:hypothetical protein
MNARYRGWHMFFFHRQPESSLHDVRSPYWEHSTAA